MDNSTVITLIGMTAAAVTIFYVTIHRLKEYFRDELKKHSDKIHKLELELRDLKSRDDSQQQILDLLTNSLYPVIQKAFESFVKKGGKDGNDD